MESKKYAQLISQVIAIMIPAGFVVSTIYDWGFLYALNLSFNEVPTTISDHFRTGVLWFPTVFAVVVFYWAIEYQFQKVEKGLTENEIIENSPNPEKTRKFRDGPYKMIIWTAPLGILNFLLIGDVVAGILPFSLTLMWLGFANWCYSAPLIQQRRKEELQAIFVLVPIVGILAFFSGYSSSVDASQHKPSIIEIMQKSTSKKIKVTLIRTFEKGMLLLSEDKKISFMPWSEIRSYNLAEKYHPYQGLSCQVFGRCINDAAEKNF